MVDIMSSQMDRIKEVLNLEEYKKKQKKQFRRKILSTILAIGLITAAVLFWIYYG